MHGASVTQGEKQEGLIIRPVYCSVPHSGSGGLLLRRLYTGNTVSQTVGRMTYIWVTDQFVWVASKYPPFFHFLHEKIYSLLLKNIYLKQSHNLPSTQYLVN